MRETDPLNRGCDVTRPVFRVKSHAAGRPRVLEVQPSTRVSHKKVSEFLLDAGIIAANQTLADRTRFELGEEKRMAFQAALDAPARHWYLTWGFEPSPPDPYHLFLLMKDLKAMAGSP